MNRYYYQKKVSVFRRPLTAALSGLVLLLLAGGLAEGNGVVRDTIGPVPSGRGGTNIAYSDNLSLMNDNPAGLTKMAGLKLELALDLLKVNVEYQEPGQSVDNKNEILFLPELILTWQALETPRPLVLGLGVFMPAGYGAEYKMNHAVYGRQKYLSEAGLTKIMTTVSYEVLDGLSLGGGAGLAYEKVTLETPYTFQTGALAGVPALVKLKGDGFGFAWNLGLQYEITERWTVGAAYIGETKTRVEGDFDLDVTGSPLAGLVPDPDASYDAEFTHRWPRSAGVGTTYRFQRATLALDVLWFDWSSAFNDLTFHLENGDNPTFDFLAGTTTPTDRIPLDWHDTISVRVGGEFFINDSNLLRAGYTYNTNPVPRSTLTPLIPGTLQHTISVGYGHRFGSRVNFDVAYQLSFGEKDRVDTSNFQGGDFDNSSVKAMVHWLMLGVLVSF